MTSGMTGAPTAVADDVGRKVTTFATVCRVILREVRIERNVHQAQIADILGKTASAWNKIEMGKSPLTLEFLYCACSFMQTPLSTFFAAAERYSSALYTNGNPWAILANPSGEQYSDTNEEVRDDLLTAAKAYWDSPSAPDLRNDFLRQFGSILGVAFDPRVGTFRLPPVFWYAVDPQYRAFVENQQRRRVGNN